MDGDAYTPGVYKILMVRMAEMPDELANVRVYKKAMQKCMAAVTAQSVWTSKNDAHENP